MEKLNLNPRPHVEPAPELTALEHGLTVAKLGALIFPPLATVTAFLDLLIAPRANERINDWYEDVRSHLNDIFQKLDKLTPEGLFSNEAFLSAFMQATQAAIKTHQREKLKALRNAVLNVALGKEPDPNRQQQFLALLDRFSENHLVVLNFLNDPEEYFQKRGESVPHVDRRGQKLVVAKLIYEAMPALSTSRTEKRESISYQFIELILEDLVSTHLVRLEPLGGTWAVPTPFSVRPGGASIKKMATHLGEEFLDFIRVSDMEENL